MLVFFLGSSPVFSRLDSLPFQFYVPLSYFDLRLLFPLRTYNLRHLKGPTPAPSEVDLRSPQYATWRQYSSFFFLSLTTHRVLCPASGSVFVVNRRGMLCW